MARGNRDFNAAVRPIRWEPSPDHAPFWWTSNFDVGTGATFNSAVFYTVPAGRRLCVLGISLGCDQAAINQFMLRRNGNPIWQIHFNTECDVHFGHGAMEYLAGDTLKLTATNNAGVDANFRYNVHGYLVLEI